MIGYYIHHHGRGHLTRASAIVEALGQPVTALSSLPRPDGWSGGWIDLPMDDADPVRDSDANGRLHWVPLGSAGLRKRTAAVSAWISAARPDAFVVDVSVEITLLARLHGIPTVVIALPGDRADAAHRLGFDVATAILAAWPPGIPEMLQGLSEGARERLTPVGAIGRFAPASEAASAPSGSRRVLVLGGSGGGDFSADEIAAAQRETLGWSWEHLGGSGRWVDDIWPHLCAATVVVTHAGQGAIADVSAARRPAVILPRSRPHGEQHATARVLGSGSWPAVVLDEAPQGSWTTVLEQSAALDGKDWQRWNDGGGASRAAAEIRRFAKGEAH